MKGNVDEVLDDVRQIRRRLVNQAERISDRAPAPVVLSQGNPSPGSREVVRELFLAPLWVAA